MTSAHRSSESAHRSGDPELKTEVFIVQTSDTQNGVIVSFVDTEVNDVEGIYFYEPGAEPVEIASVRLNGVATEFEHATVETVYMSEAAGESEEWPGDGMVTRAERDAAVEAATENLGNLQQAYDTLREQAQALVGAAERAHADSDDDFRHGGVFAWCSEPVCQAARSVEL